MTINLRFYRPGDDEQLVKMGKRVFPIISDIPPEFWKSMEQHNHATVIAEQDGMIVGAIPFDMRDFMLRPGARITAAYAHLVMVDAIVRDQGVGSQMMKFAKKELLGRCDALFVYTGHEGRQPYTFYEKNGFIDLLHSRPTYLDPPSPSLTDGHVQVTPLDPANMDSAELEAVFHRRWARFGGFPYRCPGYYPLALTALIFVELPNQFYLSARRTPAGLEGYAIIGLQGSEAIVHELTDDPEYCPYHLAAAAQLAQERGMKTVSMYASTSHPGLTALRQAGFKFGPRAHAEVIAAQVLEYENIWRALAGSRPGFALDIWTPTRTVHLPGDGPTFTLEMKEPTLHRLLLCREDLNHLLESEWVTTPDADLPVDALQGIFRRDRWVYHSVDWI